LLQTKSYRQGFGARHALSCLRGRIALDLKCAATGFAWAENRHGSLHARWQQEGFDLVAAVVNDEDGWWASGVSCIGRFSRRWEPGAIRHYRGDRNACEWFLPANFGDPKDEYSRACGYGRDGWYVGVKVKASIVPLGLSLRSLAFEVFFLCWLPARPLRYSTALPPSHRFGQQWRFHNHG